MSSGIKQAQRFEQALADEEVRATGLAQATPQGQKGRGLPIDAPRATFGNPRPLPERQGTAQPDELPPMTAESARRLAALLAPHLMAMRVVTAGTPYGADTEPAASAQLPPASAATRIFIAGMLERISA